MSEFENKKENKRSNSSFRETVIYALSSTERISILDGKTAAALAEHFRASVARASSASASQPCKIIWLKSRVA